MRRTALLIDGGYLRALAQKAELQFDPDFIEAFATGCVERDTEDIIRILYYDCPPYSGRQRLPVSGGTKLFSGSREWLDVLATRELFAIRLGTLGFRGWTPRNIPIAGRELSDDDFRPNFEQKGVDMRVGLDLATFANERSVERIVLVSGDTDMIPAMKHGRRSGLQIVVAQLPRPPAIRLSRRLLAHADYCRDVPWPDQTAQ